MAYDAKVLRRDQIIRQHESEMGQKLYVPKALDTLPVNDAYAVIYKSDEWERFIVSGWVTTSVQGRLAIVEKIV